jgi:hypothetical protein
MDTSLLSRKFEEIGARLQFTGELPHQHRTAIDIKVDRQGEYFDIRVKANDEVEYEVVDTRPDMRHLLLLARRERGKQKFLCGHDERHWFVCAVPGGSVSSVVKAMEALQPVDVRRAVSRRVKRAKDRLRRKNKGFVRQGEWFFIPMPSLTVDPRLVIKNEPLRRGFGSKAHMCQYAFRSGGEVVWVSRRHPQGVNEIQYRQILLTFPDAKRWDWRQMRREPTVYVRGRIWHPDHKTILLNDWHRVLMNTEREAPGASMVVFLD